MRHLGRVHGITVAWLHERYKGLFELRYEPSATMSADIFTKGFSSPDLWRAVTRLVSVVKPEDVGEFCASNGAPLPPPQGGIKAGKAGEWLVHPDGSGTWTRWDRGATRFSTLFSAGPLRQEVYERVTYDSQTGEEIGRLARFNVAKNINDELPSPRPRDIRSVFHFKASSKATPGVANSSVAAAAWRPTLWR